MGTRVLRVPERGPTELMPKGIAHPAPLLYPSHCVHLLRRGRRTRGRRRSRSSANSNLAFLKAVWLCAPLARFASTASKSLAHLPPARDRLHDSGARRRGSWTENRAPPDSGEYWSCPRRAGGPSRSRHGFLQSASGRTNHLKGGRVTEHDVVRLRSRHDVPTRRLGQASRGQGERAPEGVLLQSSSTKVVASCFLRGA